MIVDYLGQQYIIEPKIWRGLRYNAEGEKQISEYLDYLGLSTGYMVSLNFNKKKKPGVNPVHIGISCCMKGGDWLALYVGIIVRGDGAVVSLYRH